MERWAERVESLADYWHMHVMEVLGGWSNWDEEGDVEDLADPIRGKIQDFAAPTNGAFGAKSAVGTLVNVEAVLSEANNHLVDAKDALNRGEWTGAAADQFIGHINACTNANQLFGDTYIGMMRTAVDAYIALVNGMAEELMVLSKHAMDALAKTIKEGGVNIDVGGMIADGIKDTVESGPVKGVAKTLVNLLTDVAGDGINELFFGNDEERADLEEFKNLLDRLAAKTDEAAEKVAAGFNFVQKKINEARANDQIEPGYPDVVTQKRFEPGDFIPEDYSNETKPAERKGDEKVPAEREVKPEYRDRIKVSPGDLVEEKEKPDDKGGDRKPKDHDEEGGPGVGTSPGGQPTEKSPGGAGVGTGI